MTEDIQFQILDLLSQGKLLVQITKILEINASTIQRYRIDNPIFDAAYLRAQEVGMELRADNLLLITDQYPDVNEARLISDNTKWILARRYATRYGDKVSVDLNHSVDLRSALADARQRSVSESTQHVETPALSQRSATDTESVNAEKEECLDNADEIKALLGQED